MFYIRALDLTIRLRTTTRFVIFARKGRHMLTPSLGLGDILIYRDILRRDYHIEDRNSSDDFFARIHSGSFSESFNS